MNKKLVRLTDISLAYSVNSLYGTGLWSLCAGMTNMLIVVHLDTFNDIFESPFMNLNDWTLVDSAVSKFSNGLWLRVTNK